MTGIIRMKPNDRKKKDDPNDRKNMNEWMKMYYMKLNDPNLTSNRMCLFILKLSLIEIAKICYGTKQVLADPGTFRILIRLLKNTGSEQLVPDPKSFQ